MKKKMLIVLWTALAVLSLVYGMMVAAVRSGNGFFVFWIGLTAVFGFFAVAAGTGILNRWPVWARGAMLFVICIVLAAFVIVEGLIISKFQERGRDGLDYIIVLGAQVYEDGPSVVLKYRLDRAIEYLERNPETRCIVTGAKGDNEPFAEARGMAEYLKKNGISPERIIEEPEAKTTVQNIENSMKLMEKGTSAGLITNNFHLYRAMQIAEKNGLTDVCGIAADSTPLYLPNNMVREFFAVLAFWIGNL